LLLRGILRHGNRQVPPRREPQDRSASDSAKATATPGRRWQLGAAKRQTQLVRKPGQIRLLPGRLRQKAPIQTGDYSKKSWWGNKDYKPAKYEGNTDGSRFQTASRHDGQGARETGQSAGFSNTYRTGRYGTGAARESAVSNLAKPSDAVTDRRREVFQAPEIIDYQEQRSLSLEQSKGILGR
jgi:hypothetical protein